jgi:hypothetical protein
VVLLAGRMVTAISYWNGAGKRIAGLCGILVNFIVFI